MCYALVDFCSKSVGLAQPHAQRKPTPTDINALDAQTTVCLALGPQLVHLVQAEPFFIQECA